MITVNIGRTFLRAYNRKYEKELTAKEFFDQEYFELFYNHNKFMQWIQNSPFDQLQKQKKHFSEPERRKKLSELISNIEGGVINGSTAFGFPASMNKGFATTSGLVTDINRRITSREAFYSWIGSGLGIGIEGGFSFYFDNPDILLAIFDGWKVYRAFLNDDSIEKLGERQIDTWNGQWIYYIFYRQRNRVPDFATFHDVFEYDKTKGELRATTIKWSKLLFSLSKKLGSTNITGFIGTFGNTNKTLGFYPFQFEHAQKLIFFYKKLFGHNAALSDASKYEELYGKNIYEACKSGSIGLQALEPKGLREYFKKADKMPNLKKSKVSRKKDQSDEEFSASVQEAEKKDYENKIIPFRIYKTWLLAMITKNKEESLEYTKEVAEALHEYRIRATKTDRINLIQNDLLVAKSKKGFINALVKIVEDTKQDIIKHELDGSILDVYKNLRDRVHMMNVEDFGYFVVLLKFDFAFVERKLNS